MLFIFISIDNFASHPRAIWVVVVQTMEHKTYISHIKCILQFVGVIQERGIFLVLFILSSVWLPNGLFIAPCPDAALRLSSCGHCQDITTLLCAPGTV